MPRRRIALLVAALVLLSLQFANGQQTRADPIFTKIDTNADGKLSKIEVQTAAVAIRQLDVDGDGGVSGDEASGRGSSAQSRGSSQGRGGSNGGRDSKGSGSRLGGYTSPPPANNIPAHPFNIIVGRLTDSGGTVRVLLHSDAMAHLIYGSRSGKLSNKTDIQDLRPGEPFDFVITKFARNARCYYRLVYQAGGETWQSDEYSFHTQRDKDSSFVFSVQADSHLDENTSGAVYLRTLDNAFADQPDFHFALGDTFMTGKYVKPELSEPQYLAQRYYLGQLCHSAGLYCALGNHDGESGNRGSNVWARQYSSWR